YRERAPWMLGREPAGEATVSVSADATFWVDRLFGTHGELEEHDDGTARFATAYSDIAALSAWILSLGGQVTPLDPPQLVRLVASDLKAARRAHSGQPAEVVM